MAVDSGREQVLQGLELQSKALRNCSGKVREFLWSAAFETYPGEQLREDRQFLGPLALRSQDDAIGLQDER
jgi:hypothetical protein